MLKLTRQATLLYGELSALNDLKSRLRLESPSPGLYLLTIQNMTVQDSGTYDCRVEEWILGPTNAWYKRAEDLSGLTTIVVKQPGKVICGSGALGHQERKAQSLLMVRELAVKNIQLL